MALIAIHREERGKTDRDRDIGIFQSFTDEVSPSTRNVGILANNAPITNRNGECVVRLTCFPNII
jgi:hypothetical protein